MVWFQCEDCGDNLKKPKLNGHFRSCSAHKLSCIDCGVIFDQKTVQLHTTCVTEAEKYGPKGLTPKGPNPASRKAPAAAAVDIQLGLSQKPPWRCSLCGVNATSEETLLAHAQGKKHQSKARSAAAKLKASEVPDVGDRATAALPVEAPAGSGAPAVELGSQIADSSVEGNAGAEAKKNSNSPEAQKKRKGDKKRKGAKQDRGEEEDKVEGEVVLASGGADVAERSEGNGHGEVKAEKKTGKKRKGEKSAAATEKDKLETAAEMTRKLKKLKQQKSKEKTEEITRQEKAAKEETTEKVIAAEEQEAKGDLTHGKPVGAAERKATKPGKRKAEAGKPELGIADSNLPAAAEAGLEGGLKKEKKLKMKQVIDKAEKADKKKGEGKKLKT